MPENETGKRAIAWVVWVAALGLAGCHTPNAPSRDTVSSQITERFGHTLTNNPTCDFVLPPGARIEDGVTEDEAIAIALWNNAAFQDLLLDLGIARGDLITAGLLPNPEFVYFFEVPNKPMKYLFDFAIESLWQRPIRIKAAASEADRVAQRLAQGGLDLMRDVRQAYADVVLAKERVRVARESLRLRGQIAEYAEKRLEEGDISKVEVATARIDSLLAQQDVTRMEYEVPIAEERLRNLMGLGPLRGPLPLDPTPTPPKLNLDPDALTEYAMKTRPDVLAAVEATRAAEERLRLSKIAFFRFLGIADATSGRKKGNEFGPAVRVTLPIFNRNQGLIARGEAELERGRRQEIVLRNQVVLEVQRSYAQYQQAAAELEFLRSKVRPEVQAAIKRAQLSFDEGETGYLVVLETTRQLIDSYLREAILEGDVRRFWAELERSVGHKLMTPEPTQPALPEPKPVPPMKPTITEERKD